MYRRDQISSSVTFHDLIKATVTQLKIPSHAVAVSFNTRKVSQKDRNDDLRPHPPYAA